MKTFLILCVVLVARIQADFVSPFPKQYDQIVDACRAETGYTDEVVAKEEESYFSENRGLRIFNYCFLEKTGFVTSDGELHIDDALAKLGPGLFKDIAKNCSRREKKYAKTVFQTCFHSGISTSMRLLEFKHVIETYKENFTQTVEVCRNETDYTDEVITEENENDDPYGYGNAGLTNFIYCFLGKTGFINTELFKIDIVLEVTPQENVTRIVEHCKSQIAKKIITYNIPNFSACLVQGLSMYIRSTGVGSYPYGEEQYTTKIVDICHKETGFEKVLTKNFSERKGLREFNDCFLEKTGFITSDGKLNIDAALAKLSPGFAKPFVEHCQANIILKYINESVHDFSTCFHHEVQNHILSYYGFTNYWGMRVPGTSFAKNNGRFTTLFYDDDFDSWLSKAVGFL